MSIGNLILCSFFQTYSVANLKKLVQEKTGLQPSEQRLQYAGKELVDRMTLGDYSVANNATLHLVSRLRGGLASFSKVVLTNDDCILTHQSGAATKMACGHAVSEAALYNFCSSEISKGKSCIYCPGCASEWSLQQLREHTDLSDHQLKRIEEGLNRNFCLGCIPGVMKCRGCGEIWSSSNSTDLLCPSCATKNKSDDNATVELLARCDVKTIGHASCPVIRACPHCGKLIEHQDGCKRIDCNNCSTTFCFNCLTIRPPNSSPYYPCSDKCATAGRQTMVSKRL